VTLHEPLRPRRAVLMLENGFRLDGSALGKWGEITGEVVFHTGMTGYPEVVSDPSYAGQIVTFTYPQIGNYGIAPEDFEATRIHLRGVVVRDACRTPSNWRSSLSFTELLKRRGIVGIEGVDTRALTLHLRDVGAMRGIISHLDTDPESLLGKIQAEPTMTGTDLTGVVSTKTPYTVESERQIFRVVAYDLGIKANILRGLVAEGCQVVVVPAGTSAEDVLARKPDGVFLSNGPGDPAAVTTVIKNVERLVGLVPMFGICLGHQILALALGAQTYKLKFGHHGANHPVLNLATGKVEVTSHNHGFAVKEETLSSAGLQLTHRNLNDGAVEGYMHPEYQCFAVQYHPEAAPGPHDAGYLFAKFTDLLERHRKSVHA
jgi:carbamoyl-phosphate synthase small subunit